MCCQTGWARPACLGTIVFVLTSGTIASAQDDLENVIKKAAQELAQKITKSYEKRLEEVEKQLAAKSKEIEGLKKQLATKDKEIQGLRKQLASAPKPKPKAEPKPKAKPSKAYLGVSHTDHDKGSLVVTVREGSPAAAAGLRANDVIVSIGDRVTPSAKLTEVLRSHPVGAEVRLRVVRGDKNLDVAVKLVDGEQFAKAREAAARRAAEPKDLVLGIGVVEEDGGLLIDEVKKNATGIVIGLAVGDRIVKFNGVGVKTTDEIVREVGKVKAGQKFSMDVQRSDKRMRITGIAAAGPGGKLVSTEVLEAPQAKPPAKRKDAHLGLTVQEEDRGLVVTKIVPGTGAAVWGVQLGDVVRKVNGKEIGLDALIELVQGLKAGDRISIVVDRGGKNVEISDILLGARGETVKKPGKGGEQAKTSATPKKDADPKVTKKPTPPAKPEGPQGFLGVHVQYDDIEEILVIKDLVPGGAAEKAGLVADDILLQVHGKSVKNFDSLESVLVPLRAGQKISVTVRRKDKEVAVELELTEKLAS